MAQATFHFPRNFIWGTATSSHQVEGNNTNNNWWAWEKEPGRIKGGDQSGLACDWWNGRWREDLDRAAGAGQNAHRMSVEWSRIQPAPDRWDENALDRYREMARGMLNRGLTPVITLHHFTDPLWLAERGGWENQAVVDLFAAYAFKVVEALREYCSLWITINEPNIVIVYGYLMGIFPPGQRSMGAARRAMANMVSGHAAAYRAIHSLQPQGRAGIATNYRSLRPARSWQPLDRWMANIQSQFFNNAFNDALVDGVLRLAGRRLRIPEARQTQDYIGVNYYTRSLVAFDLTRSDEFFSRMFYPPGSDLSDTGFLANEPEGMSEALKWATRYNLPIYITENGVEDADDHLRPRYLVQHLHNVWKAVNQNLPVKGYFHWSLLDNFEWERGWTQRFGLWELEIDTQTRKKRPSVDLYAEICKENGISSEMVARFTPELFSGMFPN